MSRRPARSEPAETTLVAFGARWCPPWQLMQPMLDRLAADGVRVHRVDVDEDEAAAERHRVISLPTFVIERGGTERRRILGAVSETELAAHLARRR